MSKKNKENSSEVEAMAEVSGNSKVSGVDDLIKKNLEVGSEILETVRYIKRYVVWMKIWGVIKVLIILIPLMIGFLYLPPLLNNLYGQYKSLLGDAGVLGDLSSKLPEDISLESIGAMMSGDKEMTEKEAQQIVDNMNDEDKQKVLEYLEKNKK
ncbi:hypothetical protein GF382_00625 [Candidatus Falkowbacteria bacterium]|nr:hypothetical protein [Candidatus Falkowbacteria bacterium]